MMPSKSHKLNWHLIWRNVFLTEDTKKGYQSFLGDLELLRNLFG